MEKSETKVVLPDARLIECGWSATETPLPMGLTGFIYRHPRAGNRPMMAGEASALQWRWNEADFAPEVVSANAREDRALLATIAAGFAARPDGIGAYADRIYRDGMATAIAESAVEVFRALFNRDPNVGAAPAGEHGEATAPPPAPSSGELAELPPTFDVLLATPEDNLGTPIAEGTARDRLAIHAAQSYCWRPYYDPRRTPISGVEVYAVDVEQPAGRKRLYIHASRIVAPSPSTT